jgi:PKD repeat protein
MYHILMVYMKYILYLLVLSVLATGITSCESDSTSSDGTTKELEVTPSKTSLGVYESFTIKARMTNTALSDVDMKIDFGDGAIDTRRAGYEISHSYTLAGTYTVTVKAIDVYTEDTIATKTVQIIVSDVIPHVAFDSDNIDASVMISDFSAELDGVTFTFTTNAKISKVRYQFGDGTTLTDSTAPSYSTSHSYQSPGTYTVILDVYNDKGNYWASDTMKCTIRLQEATLDMLTGSYNATVAFAVDSTSSMYPSVKSYEHLEAGIGNINDATPDVTWTGNSFDAHYVSGSRQDFHFTGAISSDFKKLESMTVSISDSILDDRVSTYSYRLSNLEFYGMNNEVVIYRAVYRELSSFASDINFSGDMSFIRRVGNRSDMLYQIKNLQTPRPYAYVIFTRK